MYIGKIVSASSHVDYVCQVYGPGEAEELPAGVDYGFGAFVAIEGAGGGAPVSAAAAGRRGSAGAACLVGIIGNTTLLNPEFGNLGPRLSPREDLAVFSPDYLAEKATLVAIAVVGMLRPGQEAYQGVPPAAAAIDDRVRRLGQEEIAAFHRSARGLRLAYLPLLMGGGAPLAAELATHVLASLGPIFPDEARRLAVLAQRLSWRARIEPLG